MGSVGRMGARFTRKLTRSKVAFGDSSADAAMTMKKEGEVDHPPFIV